MADQVFEVRWAGDVWPSLASSNAANRCMFHSQLFGDVTVTLTFNKQSYDLAYLWQGARIFAACAISYGIPAQRLAREFVPRNVSGITSISRPDPGGIPIPRHTPPGSKEPTS
jgi:hypothetical protein